MNWFRCKPRRDAQLEEALRPLEQRIDRLTKLINRFRCEMTADLDTVKADEAADIAALTVLATGLESLVTLVADLKLKGASNVTQGDLDGLDGGLKAMFAKIGEMQAKTTAALAPDGTPTSATPAPADGSDTGSGQGSTEV